MFRMKKYEEAPLTKINDGNWSKTAGSSISPFGKINVY